MTTAIAADILARGEPAIDQVIQEKRGETLHLEFKTLSGSGGLTRDDRKMIPRAICGFCNAEGGLLVIGVETKRVDNVDVAFAARPVSEIDRIRSMIAGALPDMLSPQHNGVKVEAVHCSDNAACGYILVDIPASDDRPHMSLSDQRYYRRGSDGTRVLVHGEVRDLMFINKEGALELKCTVRSGVSQGQSKFQLWLRLNICNVGKIPIVAPFLRIAGAGYTVPESLQPRSWRNNNKEFYGVYTTRDVVVHIDDELAIAEIATGLDFSRLKLGNAQAIIAAISSGLHDEVSMLPWSSMQGNQGAPQQSDVPINVRGSFGAENARARQFDLRIGKKELLELFAQNLGR